MATDSVIGEACRILTTFKHCERQAVALRRCQAAHQGSTYSFFGIHGSGSACAREEAAFETCSNERLEPVVSDLMKIASVKCPNQVAAFERCILTKGSDVACEQEDLRAMECGARHVVASASAS
jgi:hypothetical protein